MVLAALGLGGSQRPATPVLCDLSATPITFTATPGTPFAVPLPTSAGTLLGFTFCAQGISADGTLIALTNAIDFQLGTP